MCEKIIGAADCEQKNARECIDARFVPLFGNERAHTRSLDAHSSSDSRIWLFPFECECPRRRRSPNEISIKRKSRVNYVHSEETEELTLYANI